MKKKKTKQTNKLLMDALLKFGTDDQIILLCEHSVQYMSFASGVKI